MSSDKMEKETKVATEDPKIDLFEDDDDFEDFEINEGSHGDGHHSNTDTPLVAWGAGVRHHKVFSFSHSVLWCRMVSLIFGCCIVQGLAKSSVSLSFGGKSLRSLRLQSAPLRFRVSCVAKPATVDKVCEIVRKQLALPAESAVCGESKFAALGADSLDTVEIVMGLEEEFGISVEEESAQTISTVQDAADLIENLVEKKESA